MPRHNSPMSVVAMLGGRDLPDDVVRAWSASATALYAADSGADRLLALGFRPTVVGDMDSFKGTREGLRVVESADQETSDLDKLLGVVVEDGHSRLVILGLEGDRLDHVLVGLHSLAESALEVLLVLRRGLGFFVKEPHSFEWAADAGARCSAIRLGDCRLTMAGVRWPLESAVGESLSNIIGPEPLVVKVSGSPALVTIERDPMRVVPW